MGYSKMGFEEEVPILQEYHQFFLHIVQGVNGDKRYFYQDPILSFKEAD